MSGRWFRDIYRDAVWESEELTAQEKAVAETYARHARDEHDDKSAIADLAWTTYPRLMAKAGIGRRANVSTAVASLVEKGWLTVVREVSRRPTLYRLTIPGGSSTPGTTETEGASSTPGTTETEGASSTPGTTVVPPSPSGSSTSAAGSSDGGTQPLGPLENQPSTSSLSARTSLPAPRDPDDDRERDDTTSSKDQNLTEQQQIVINDGACPPHLAQLVVEYTEMIHEVRNIVWWRRVKAHGDTPRIVREALNALPDNIDSPGDFTRDDTPCPLHPHCRARNCQSCWGDVKAGQDPYRHRPELRPAWFKETYNLQPRTSQRGQDGKSVNRPEGARTAEGERRRAENRTPRGGQLGRVFAGREADWDEKL